MPGDKDDLFPDYVVGCRHRLFRIASVIGDDQVEFLAEHPALGVDVGDRHLGAPLHLLAERGIRACDRPDHRNRHVLRVGDTGGQRKRRRQDDRMDQVFHETPPSTAFGLTVARRQAQCRPPSR